MRYRCLRWGVLGVEELWEGARLEATEGGDLRINRQDFEVLTGASKPVEQKLAVLKRLEFAAPLFSSDVP